MTSPGADATLAASSALAGPTGIAMDLNEYGVELTCPTCIRNFTVSLGALNESPRTRCPGCSQPIEVPANEIQAALDAVEGDD